MNIDVVNTVVEEINKHIGRLECEVFELTKMVHKLKETDGTVALRNIREPSVWYLNVAFPHEVGQRLYNYSNRLGITMSYAVRCTVLDHLMPELSDED